MVDILMSTYNGEKYLAEQIDSLLNQTYISWHLIIRDDGSTDKTLSVIYDYCNQYPEQISLLRDDKGNVGSIHSFELLLQNSKADYMMFCDQDDVWLQNKIETMLAKMQNLETKYGKGTPILVHSDLFVVDENLNEICSSFWEFAGIKPCFINKDISLLGISNTVTGCASIMNKALQMKSLPFPQHTKMHDAWIGLCAKKYGVLEYFEQPTVLYRQHRNNVIGAVKKESFFDKIKKLRIVWNENKKQYKFTHPFVFSNIWMYIINKIKVYTFLHL